MTGMLDEATHAVRETGTRIKEQAATVKEKAGKRIREVLPGHTETRLQKLRRVLRVHSRQVAEGLGVVAAVAAVTGVRRARSRGK